MEDFKAFDLVPNGIIVFENEKITFINQHMRDILNVNFLSLKNTTEILLLTLKIENEKELFLFFTQHEFFRHREKVIAIERNFDGSVDIFSFFALTPRFLERLEQQEPEPVSVKEANVDSQVSNFFRTNNVLKLKALTFYKGLPLKNFAKIVRVSNDSIDVEIDDKHKVSLLQSDDIILIAKTEKGRLVLHGHVRNVLNNIFTIHNFKLVKEDMHLRQSIRIKPSTIVNAIVHDRTFKVYDISELGISISISNEDEEKFLKEQKSIKITIFREILEIQIKYLKTIRSENGEILKIIFLILSAGKGSKIIHDYLSQQQTEIIREVHNYIQNNLAV